MSLLSATLVLWRVLAVCIPLGIGAGWLSYEIGHREGQLAERVEVAKASTRNAQEWIKWLEGQRKKDDAFDAAMRDVIELNVEASRRVDEEIAASAAKELEDAKQPDQKSDVPAVVPDDRDCLSPGFLRSLRQLR